MKQNENLTVATVSMELGKALRIANKRVETLEKEIENRCDDGCDFDTMFRKTGLDNLGFNGYCPDSDIEIDGLEINYYANEKDIEKLQAFVDKVQDLIYNFEPHNDDDDYNPLDDDEDYNEDEDDDIDDIFDNEDEDNDDNED